MRRREVFLLLRILVGLALMMTLGATAAACRASGETEPAPATACETGSQLHEGKCVPCPAWKGTCEAVGVAAAGGCAKGFVDDGRGGCDAILPEAACAPGTMAVPGDTACREVALCGTGTWGDIQDEPGTLYVHKGYTGAGSDGSRAKPFTTIQAALDVAATGALVAIGDGLYPENVRIVKPLRLRGRCPAKVEIRGSSTTDASVHVAATGAVVIKGVSVTGTAVGIGVIRGDVEIDQVHAHDLGGRGVGVGGRNTTATLRNALIERTHELGVVVIGSKMTIEGTVVRDTLPDTRDNTGGRGIDAVVDQSTKLAADLVVRNSLVERNREVGILVFGSKANIEGIVVRDTMPRQTDKKFGMGIDAEIDPSTQRQAELSLRGAVIERNHEVGIVVLGAKATIEATVVRDTAPREAGKTSGRGLAVEVHEGTKRPAEVVLRGVLVERNHMVGIDILGSRATIESSIVRETQPQVSDGRFGRGVSADIRAGMTSDLVVHGVLVERCHEAGIAVIGSNATIEASVIRGTLPEEARKFAGDGILVVGRPFSTIETLARAVIRATLVTQNARVGIGALGDVELKLERDRLACNPIDLATVPGTGAEPLHPRVDTSEGGTTCGCDAAGGCSVEPKDVTDIPPPETLPSR